LKDVEPVSSVTVINGIRLCLGRNDDAVDRVKHQGNENAEDLDKDQVRYVMNVLNVFVKYSRSIESRRVSVNVHEEKKA
jgi:hypothetical protein